MAAATASPSSRAKSVTERSCVRQRIAAVLACASASLTHCHCDWPTLCWRAQHHCRVCGDIFCSRCTSHRVKLHRDDDTAVSQQRHSGQRKLTLVALTFILAAADSLPRSAVRSAVPRVRRLPCDCSLSLARCRCLAPPPVAPGRLVRCLRCRLLPSAFVPLAVALRPLLVRRSIRLYPSPIRRARRSVWRPGQSHSRLRPLSACRAPSACPFQCSSNSRLTWLGIRRRMRVLGGVLQPASQRTVGPSMLLPFILSPHADIRPSAALLRLLLVVRSSLPAIAVS